MAGDTPYEAVEAFVAPIQAAISCFVRGKVTADRAVPDQSGRMVLNRNQPVRLPGPARLSVELGMTYQIVGIDDPDRGPWKVSTTGWIYHLTGPRGEALVQYHWHPETNVDFPHMHHGDGGVHYPTGRVLVEDVLLAATELGAEPEDPAMWAVVHTENRAKFERGATWGGRGQRPDG